MIRSDVIVFIDFGIGTNCMLLCQLIMLVLEYLKLAEGIDVCPLVGKLVF